MIRGVHRAICVILLMLTCILIFDIQPPPSWVAHSVLQKASPSVPHALAHRGSRYMNPENTIRSHRVAAKYASVLETDVQQTKDGKLVIFHDDTVDRVTNGTGLVSSYTLEELLALDFAYRYTPDHGHTLPLRGKGVVLPTLEEFLETFHQHHIALELKADDIEISKKVNHVFASYPNLHHQLILTSRHCKPLAYWRKYTLFDTSACEGEGMMFFILSRFRLYQWMVLFQRWMYGVEQIQQNAPGYFHLPTNSGPIDLARKQVVDDAHAIGAKIIFWVVNDAKKMKELLYLGVDGFVTDRYDLAYQEIKSYRAQMLKDDIIPELSEEMILNASQDHFIPAQATSEIHGCVTVTCHVAHTIGWPIRYLPESVYIFLWLIVLLFGLCISKKEKIHKKVD